MHKKTVLVSLAALLVAAAPTEMIAASLLNEAETDTTGVFEDEGIIETVL